MREVERDQRELSVSGQVAGVEQGRREDLTVRLADDAGDRGQVGALRESSHAVDPPQPQVLPGDAV
jgi:hypothetical protein